MKHLNKIIFLISSTIALVPKVIFAAGSSTLLALDKVFNAIPGASGLSSGSVDLPSFLNTIFKTAISFALVLAVIRIFYGGFIYATTEAISGKNEAKGVIKGALYGLGLILASWLILYTIDPNLVSLNFLNSNVTTNQTATDQTDYNYDYDYEQ